MFALPALAWSAYDVENIKKNLSNLASLKISHWEVADDRSHWRAINTLKGVSITASEKKTELTLPFINPTQKETAKIFCEKFAITSLGITDPKETKHIAKIIKDATTRHQIKFANFSGAKFYVLPKLVGMRVSLHCVIKAPN